MVIMGRSNHQSKPVLDRTSGMGSGDASPLMACFACEFFRFYFSLGCRSDYFRWWLSIGGDYLANPSWMLECCVLNVMKPLLPVFSSLSINLLRVGRRKRCPTRKSSRSYSVIGKARDTARNTQAMASLTCSAAQLPITGICETGSLTKSQSHSIS
jgi:hypothetical protein